LGDSIPGLKSSAIENLEPGDQFSLTAPDTNPNYTRALDIASIQILPKAGLQRIVDLPK
jgi:hypothetical protein